MLDDLIYFKIITFLLIHDLPKQLIDKMVSNY